MKTRQVHLDFHTSEHIQNIGVDFDKAEFQKALQNGHIDSITVFAKCAHGWSYHFTQANEIHPHLSFDLLRAQIQAAHEIGVATPVYLSAGLDEKAARKNPEWLMRNKDESTLWTKNFSQPGYHRFCMNTPYLPYFLAQLEEVVKNYDADGIFLDVVGVLPCYCQACVTQRIAWGQDPYDEENAVKSAEQVYAQYTQKVRERVDALKPGLPVFHNFGHIRKGRRDLVAMNSHLELESLPTGEWGYDHFPLSAGYARTLGQKYLGMTGKFHTSWGEFGGFKHPNALRYEIAMAAAFGAASSIGDQLSPNGKIDWATYQLVGKAYKERSLCEEWLEDARNVADVAFVSNEAMDNYYGVIRSQVNPADFANISDIGCTRLLLEGKYLFDVIDAAQDISRYKLVILPDNIRLDTALKQKFETYLSHGGCVLATGKSGLALYEEQFALDFGIEYTGEAIPSPFYMRPQFEIPSIHPSAYVVYETGCRVKLLDAEELAGMEAPFFGRSVLQFCSHMHAPNAEKCLGPAIVRKGNTAYIACDIFSEYATVGSITSKEMVLALLEELIGATKTVQTNLPAQGIVTVAKQQKANRTIVHLLYASPVKRGVNIEVIEDILPVTGTVVTLRYVDKPSRVTLMPQDISLNYTYENGTLHFVVDSFECWQVCVLES